jgi:hypothetical protein
MEKIDVKRQMEADASMSRGEIVAVLLADIHDKSRAAAVRRVARKRRLAIEFGAQYGWKLSEKRFGLLALKRGSVFSMIRDDADVSDDHLPHELFDHLYFYRRAKRAVAIVAHPYHFDQDAAAAFAKKHDLCWESPAFPSWWYPGATTLIVFKKRQRNNSEVGDG